MELYPLQFNPIFKERIWGGEKLKTVLDKTISSKITGESWEISTVKGDVSIVSKGFYAGKSLNDLIDFDPKSLLGNKVFERFGKEFPLLFKYLDAREDLSIQVHPNDQLANERHNSFGKTEMWYVLQADKDSNLIVGFKEDSNSKEYIENLENKTLLNILDKVKVNEGDVFFLETGTVHAIGAGLVIAEIQQTSDITYRLYDFDRVDTAGNQRELHIDLALDAINYKKIDTFKKYKKHINAFNLMVDCPYFATSFIPLNGEIVVNKNEDSFTVFMCIKGTFDIEYNESKFSYKKGDTILVPAALSGFKIQGTASILEICIS